MPYITFIKPMTAVRQRERMTTQEMIMAQIFPDQVRSLHSKNFFRVRTMHKDINELHRTLAVQFTTLLDSLQQEYTKEYIHFRIPKASGGTRHIEAPAGPLKLLQRQVASALIDDLKILPHDAAYAYTRGRCAYDAMVTHQRKNARWFLKLDIKDFFPSIDAETLMRKLPDIYPLMFLSEHQMTRLVNLAINDEGVLPQGSPLSPMLSNLVMTEFDLNLTHKLYELSRGRMTYTRYADDILITSAYDFQFQPIVDVVESLFTELALPFRINRAKIRYASCAGSNWNLGLMYNKDQKITVGNKRKKILHSLLNSFVVDYIGNNYWDVQETQELIGKLGYLKNVEPEYYQTLIDKYQAKYPAINIKDAFKFCLNRRV